MEGQKTELKMIQMSEVESQEVKWLTHNWFAEFRTRFLILFFHLW